MNELTKSEKMKIWRLKDAIRRLPPDLKIYVVDGSACICKVGVSSSEICEGIGDGLRECCVLADMHDDMNNGQY